MHSVEVYHQFCDEKNKTLSHNEEQIQKYKKFEFSNNCGDYYSDYSHFFFAINSCYVITINNFETDIHLKMCFWNFISQTVPRFFLDSVIYLGISLQIKAGRKSKISSRNV